MDVNKSGGITVSCHVPGQVGAVPEEEGLLAELDVLVVQVVVVLVAALAQDAAVLVADGPPAEVHLGGNSIGRERSSSHTF